MTKIIPKWGEKWEKAKWLSEEALQIDEERREMKQGRKGKIYPTECRIAENSQKRLEGLPK